VDCIAYNSSCDFQRLRACDEGAKIENDCCKSFGGTTDLQTINIFIVFSTSQIILAVWLVVTYDLLGGRRIDDVVNGPKTSRFYVAVTHPRKCVLLFCSDNIWRHLSSITEQTHGTKYYIFKTML